MSKIAKSIAVLGVVAGLGVAALPLSTYASTETSGPVQIQAKVSKTIGISVNRQLVDMGTVMPGADPASADLEVTVNTSETGYNLAIVDEDEDNNLVLDDTAATATDVIPAGVAANGTTAWGWRVGKGAYAAVPENNAAGTATGTQITGAAALVSGEATTTVNFGVSLASGSTIAEGIYKDTVVFRATAPAA